MSGDGKQAQNRLAKESSPYLRQHAGNPVDWYPWGEEALSRSRHEDKPIFLSIGYSACHWCHVMERESFENPEIAALMNDLFVNVKVDREERPDLDAIYMQAVQLMTGSGGWPMSVWLTPELKPFYGGTYFPPTEQYGRPSFPTVLRAVADAYAKRRPQLEESAKELTQAIAASEGLKASDDPLTHEPIHRFVRDTAARFDRRYGGQSGAPKFPPSMQCELLLRFWHRTGDVSVLDMVELTLDRMAAGGMYDQIGGGFHRYSVDEKWLVPHFEKMLYDNALLLRAYSTAYAATRNRNYRDIAQQIAAYIKREMTHPHGPFYATQDADSEGEEGKFFVWTPGEMKTALGEEADFAMRAFGVSEEGNFEGGEASVLSMPFTVEELAKQESQAPETVRDRLGKIRCKLFGEREKRIKPHRDEKILAAWNGLTIGALAHAARHAELGAEALTLARRAADWVLANLWRDGSRLWAVYGNGEAKLNGYLDDYAFLAQGLLDLYLATGDPLYFRRAKELADSTIAHFEDSEGGFRFTSDDHEKLIARLKEGQDNAIPSGNSAMAQVLLLLYELSGERKYLESARRTMSAFGQLTERVPAAFPQLLCAQEQFLNGTETVVIVGELGEPLESLALELWNPDRVVLRVEKETAEPALLDGKVPLKGIAAAYVCRNRTCDAPVSEVSNLEALLARKR